MDKANLIKVCEALKTLEETLRAICADAPEEPAVSLEEVRRALADKSAGGFTAEVRELIRRYGSDRLSEVDPKEYRAILKEAEAIGNE